MKFAIKCTCRARTLYIFATRFLEIFNKRFSNLCLSLQSPYAITVSCPALNSPVYNMCTSVASYMRASWDLLLSTREKHFLNLGMRIPDEREHTHRQENKSQSDGTYIKSCYTFQSLQKINSVLSGE